MTVGTSNRLSDEGAGQRRKSCRCVEVLGIGTHGDANAWSRSLFAESARMLIASADLTSTHGIEPGASAGKLRSSRWECVGTRGGTGNAVAGFEPFSNRMVILNNRTLRLLQGFDPVSGKVPDCDATEH